MDMTPQTAWLIAISAVVLVGVVAFFIGRSTAGTKARIDELEAELSSKRAEVEGYRKEVEQHFDKTATLFVSMAGSYKEMFEHLSSGYEKLSTGSARELFQQRVDSLLIGSARGTGAADDAGKLLGGVAAGTAVAAAAAAAGTATDADAAQAGAAAQVEASAASETSAAAEGSAEPEWRAEPTPAAGAPGAAPAFQTESEAVAADESDERVRMAEGIAFDPTVDEAPVRSEAPHSELR